MTSPNAGNLIVTSGSAIVASVVRTFVPVLVGLLITVFSKINIELDSDTATSLIMGLVSAGISLVYYVLVRILEIWKSGKFGWLLGFAKAPVYVPAATAALASGVVVESGHG